MHNAAGSKSQKLTSRKEWNKTEYLKEKHVIGLVNYICNLESADGGGLAHEYEIKWTRHIKAKGGVSTLRIDSLSNAFEEYFWPAIDSDYIGPAKTDFKSNESILMLLSKSLKDSLNAKKPEALFIECIKILDWGQVYKGSISWIVNQYEMGRLHNSISTASEILAGDEMSCLAKFESGQLRIDSGLTKIYALASDNSIIYDDRVGAALGLLAKRYLESQEQHNCSITGTPDELDFMPGRDKTRNPSTSILKFGKRENNSSYIHARSNLLANWLVGTVAERLGDSWDRRKVEAALFMIGYRVS